MLAIQHSAKRAGRYGLEAARRISRSRILTLFIEREAQHEIAL